MSEEDQILAKLYQCYPQPSTLNEFEPIAVQKLAQRGYIEAGNNAGYVVTVEGYRRLKRRWPTAISD